MWIVHLYDMMKSAHLKFTVSHWPSKQASLNMLSLVPIICNVLITGFYGISYVAVESCKPLFSLVHSPIQLPSLVVLKSRRFLFMCRLASLSKGQITSVCAIAFSY